MKNFFVQDELINLDSYNLYKEIDRQKSFIENHWSNQFVKYEDLAQIGFYFLRRPDIVCCRFCDVVLGEFEENDIPLKEHQKFSPNCPLLLKRFTKNIPINQSKLDKILPKSYPMNMVDLKYF
ncbi:hypothetical protein PVAND_006729 [Polypedilum vanderplanki]|uniref:Uncharacterized protein n=1 Tax=Polypedilum vanderplanki TaxID=319348 RepID=A0A9J6C436_POLVA|nr:hypothetical protein PVAND_006729 [Polypedilum vanderplanki]